MIRRRLRASPPAPAAAASATRIATAPWARPPSPAALPSDFDRLLGEANAAFTAGRIGDARTRILAAIAQAPQRSDLHLALAQIELAAGAHAAAEAACRHAQQLAPADPAPWNMLGEVLRTTNAAAAEDAWRQALELDPDNAEARFHLGNLYRERGAPREAIAEYERALALSPRHIGLLNNLGLALEAVGERDRAIECYRNALACAPNQPDALANLANALYDREDYFAAATAYDQLFAVRQDLDASVWTRRGVAQQSSGRAAAAEASFREAAAHAPETRHARIGSTRLQQGRYADADAPLSRALELEPQHGYALTMLAHARQTRCAWDGLDSLFEKLEHLLAHNPGRRARAAPPFPLLAMPLSLQVQLKAATNWANEIGWKRAAEPATPRPAPVDGERLRIGFVSADFRGHAVAMLMTEFWERLDRGRFETFAYGIMPEDSGPIGQRIRKAFEHFADVSSDSAAAIAERIRDDRIAILFDLNGFTGDARAEIFAMRPASIQINMIGHPGTLGAEWYDYILVDRFLAPPAMQPYFTERFLEMPNALFPCDTTRAPKGPPPMRAECGLPEQGFVFCCFNGSYKILPPVFATWMRLLHAVPGSVLWLAETHTEATANLLREAERAGIASERLVFAPRVSSSEHIARCAVADLFLDTAPYGAGATANDALLAGLPIVTCAGDTLVSRICGSQLHAIGLPELVTTSLADYEALALRLAQHPSELAALRARLAANRSTTPLFDIARYTRDFEQLMLQLRLDQLERSVSA